MARAARTSIGTGRGAALRVAISFVTLLAFVLQTLLLQTHIHGTAFVAGAPLTLEKSQQPDKFPPANDPANCPICQEVLHAGAFVAPSAVAVQAATLTSVIAFVFVEILATTQTYAHGWKSRAPPLA